MIYFTYVTADTATWRTWPPIPGQNFDKEALASDFEDQGLSIRGDIVLKNLKLLSKGKEAFVWFWVPDGLERQTIISDISSAITKSQRKNETVEKLVGDIGINQVPDQFKEHGIPWEFIGYILLALGFIAVLLKGMDLADLFES